LLDTEKSRAGAGIALRDAAGLNDLVDNLEAAGRRDRAIEAILYFWLVVNGDARNKAQTRRRKFGIAKRVVVPTKAADRRGLWPVIGRQGPILQ
jgi:hypothetical protein